MMRNNTELKNDTLANQQPVVENGIRKAEDGDRAECLRAAEFVTVDELAAELGVNRKTLYNAIHAPGLPGVRRIGGRIRIHRPTVVDWFRKGQGSVPRSRSR